jgi:cell division septal protein FtsQ
MATRKGAAERRKPRTMTKRRASLSTRNKGVAKLLKYGVPLVFIIAITFGLSFMLLMGYRTATASSFFDVKAIELNGLNRASKDEIENIVRKESERTGVWNSDLAVIRREVEELTFVKTAVVSRVLPDGIRINIVERIPRAVVRTESKDFWVDDEAFVLKGFDKNSEALPFYLKGWDEAKTLNAVGDNKARVKIYLTMLQDWQDFDLVKRVTEVDLSDLQSAKAVVKDSGELVEITLGKGDYGKGLRNGLKAIANKGGEIKSFDVQNSVSQQREKKN